VNNDTFSMANRPFTMNKIRQILRGHFEGQGSKQLSKLTGVFPQHYQVLPENISGGRYAFR
jgi:hypothetical protein